ncbi:MAG: hypothetical protein NTZ56_18775 [Acidobacteria bacterium]|nr:hypothetical protein [Acidobacteriota bacterium]
MTAAELVQQLTISTHRMPLQRPRLWHPEWASLLRGQKPARLFPQAASPAGVQAGAWLFLGCWEEAHQVAQDLETPEGSYWHAIIHRQEPDSFNAGYWFRRVGEHAIFSPLAKAAEELGYRASRSKWDPAAFVDYCEAAAPRSAAERLALQVQHAEWKLLLNFCLGAKG